MNEFTHYEEQDTLGYLEKTHTRSRKKSNKNKQRDYSRKESKWQ